LDLDYLVLFQLALVAVAPGADGADEGLLAGVDADVGNVPLAAQEPLVAHLTPAKIFFHARDLESVFLLRRNFVVKAASKHKKKFL
jgi:hypothetical protein